MNVTSQSVLRSGRPLKVFWWSRFSSSTKNRSFLRYFSYRSVNKPVSTNFDLHCKKMKVWGLCIVFISFQKANNTNDDNKISAISGSPEKTMQLYGVIYTARKTGKWRKGKEKGSVFFDYECDYIRLWKFNDFFAFFPSSICIANLLKKKNKR